MNSYLGYIDNLFSGKFRKEFLRTFGCRNWHQAGGGIRGRRGNLHRGNRGALIRFQSSNGAGNGSTAGYVPARPGSTYTASYRYALRTEFTPTRSTYA